LATLPPNIRQLRQRQAPALLQRGLAKSRITRRFGPLPDATRARLTYATAEQLELWTDRILEAPTLAAVLMQN